MILYDLHYYQYHYCHHSILVIIIIIIIVITIIISIIIIIMDVGPNFPSYCMKGNLLIIWSETKRKALVVKSGDINTLSDKKSHQGFLHFLLAAD